MTLTCKIEPGDYRRAAWIHMRPRRAFGVVGAALVLLALFVFSVALLRFFRSGQDLTVVLFLGVAMAYLAIYFFLWIPRQLNRLYAQQKLLHGEFIFEISDEHLISRSVHGESKLPWSVFHKWKSGRDIVLLYQSDALFHVFPGRSFPSTADFDSFQAILRKHLGPNRS